MIHNESEGALYTFLSEKRCAASLQSRPGGIRNRLRQGASQAAGAAPTFRYGPAGDSAPRLRLKAAGMAERFPSGPASTARNSRDRTAQSRPARPLGSPFPPPGLPLTASAGRNESVFGAGKPEKLAYSSKIPVLFKLVPHRTAIFLGSGHQMPTRHQPAKCKIKNPHSENTENPPKQKPQDIGHQDTSSGRGDRPNSSQSRSRSARSGTGREAAKRSWLIQPVMYLNRYKVAGRYSTQAPIICKIKPRTRSPSPILARLD